VEVRSLINLRYHIVSLVAVFLAMALGIVIGSTVLKEGANRATLTALNATSQELQRTSADLRARNDELLALNGQWQRFGDAELPALVRGRLEGRAAVVLDTDKVDDGTRRAVTDALKAAGARVDAQLTFSSQRLALGGDGDRSILGALLTIGDATPETLRQELVNQLTGRLAQPRLLPRGSSKSGDLLTALSQTKFLSSMKLTDPVKKGAAALPQPGALFVVIGPTGGSTALTPQEFLIPLVDELSRFSTTVVAVERADGTDSWVQTMRAQRDVAARVSSVDDVSVAFGQMALVLALERRLQSGPVGHYGTKGGATSELPPQAAGS
jgi:Copper transport outer membrane protein, MctB